MNIYDRPTPEVDSLSDGWTIQSDRQRIAEALQFARRLEQERDALKEALEWFIGRVDKGEVRSKQSYTRFKELLRAIEERK